MAHRAAAITRGADLMGRVGHSTFVLLIKDITSNTVVSVGQRIVDALQEVGPKRPDGAPLVGGVGIGVSRPGSDADGLLACALAAARTSGTDENRRPNVAGW